MAQVLLAGFRNGHRTLVGPGYRGGLLATLDKRDHPPFMIEERVDPKFEPKIWPEPDQRGLHLIG